MTYYEVMELVRSSGREEWKYNDGRGVFTLLADVDVRIEERRSEDGGSYSSFEEPWANDHPDRNASRIFYDIYFRASFIEEFMLVSVDGGRAHLPLPDVKTGIIPLDRYRLARAVDSLGTLDEYIQRSKLTVESA